MMHRFLLLSLVSLFDYVTSAGSLDLRDQAQEPLAGLDAPASVTPDKHGNEAAKPLECFQVARPVLGPSGPVYHTADEDGVDLSESSCSVLLMDHSFDFSYGRPFVGQYTPPECDFDRVIMNFTVTSEGRQFDRLAFMFFNDTEVWRTSTAEPKPSPGIIWTYWKDMTEFLSLWRSPQKLIFDLGNLIDDKYTGSFNCTLTAVFFKASTKTAASATQPANLVIPVSARKGSSDKSSAWTLPRDKAVSTVDFPRNARRAVFSIAANGQQAEEFWWSNVLQSDAGAFNETTGRLPGLSPFREVQLYIDDSLAGVQWPFPVVFTGGVSPSLHRPVVGLEAFDLREHEIDISPWLPVLCDGKEHTFQIRVVGIYDNGKTAELTDRIAKYWVVTGKIFVWLDDDEGSVTTGNAPKVDAPQPVILMSSETRQNKSGFNEALQFTLQVQRTISVRSKMAGVTRGTSLEPSWEQTLAYSNLGAVTSFGASQVNDMNITGRDLAQGPRWYVSSYSYPLWANQTVMVEPSSGNLSIEAGLNQSLELEGRGEAVFPSGLEAFAATSDRNNTSSPYAGYKLSTSKSGQAAFYQSGDKKHSRGFGLSNQMFSFGGLASGLDPNEEASPSSAAAAVEQLYSRNVSAVNDTVIFDDEAIARGRQEKIHETIRSNVDAEYLGHFAPAKGKHSVLEDLGGGTESSPSGLDVFMAILDAGQRQTMWGPWRRDERNGHRDPW